MVRTSRTVTVLMLEDTNLLGHVGDVVKVRPGYARNYLFPAGIACPVTQDALRRIERVKARAVEERTARTERLAELAGALEGTSITLEERASEEGHLFGSVGAPAIVAAMAAQGIALDEKQVALDSPLKELGIFNVPIRLDDDRIAEIRVWIVEPGE